MEAVADRLQSLLDKARADLEVRGRRDAACGCRLRRRCSRCALRRAAGCRCDGPSCGPCAFVAERLANEFDAAYSEHGVNPLRLLARIGKLQDGLGELQAECDEVLAARQDLVEVARLKILADRRALCNMQARAGLLVSSDDEDSAYQGLCQVLQACEQHAEPQRGDLHRTALHRTMSMALGCSAHTCALALGKMFQKRSVSSPAPVTMPHGQTTESRAVLSGSSIPEAVQSRETEPRYPQPGVCKSEMEGRTFKLTTCAAFKEETLRKEGQHT
eukprot:SM000023S07621  [mRNA]  locus=s23:495287:498822:+ [translate_table: standard]